MAAEKTDKKIRWERAIEREFPVKGTKVQSTPTDSNIWQTAKVIPDNDECFPVLLTRIHSNGENLTPTSYRARLPYIFTTRWRKCWTIVIGTPEERKTMYERRQQADDTYMQSNLIISKGGDRYLISININNLELLNEFMQDDGTPFGGHTEEFSVEDLEE